MALVVIVNRRLTISLSNEISQPSVEWPADEVPGGPRSPSASKGAEWTRSRSTKRHATVETGHAVPTDDLLAVIPPWLDR
jgi:hypothetical protein